MKKKIFEIVTEQTFNALDIERRKFKLPVIKGYREKVYGIEKFILAYTLEEAIKKYQERYNWNKKDECIDYFGRYGFEYPKISSIPQFVCEVKGYEVKHIPFDKLKEKLHVSDFLEYCRQELYSPETVLLKEK